MCCLWHLIQTFLQNPSVTTKMFSFSILMSSLPGLLGLYLLLFAGPSRWPIVGNTFLIKKLSKELGGQYVALLRLSEKYKTNILGLKLGSDQYVVVFGRQLVQQVFTREEFQGRPDGFFIRLRTMGQRRGWLTGYGELTPNAGNKTVDNTLEDRLKDFHC